MTEPLRCMPDEYRCHSCEMWDNLWCQCWIGQGGQEPMDWCERWEPDWSMALRLMMRPDMYEANPW